MLSTSFKHNVMDMLSGAEPTNWHCCYERDLCMAQLYLIWIAEQSANVTQQFLIIQVPTLRRSSFVNNSLVSKMTVFFHVWLYSLLLCMGYIAISGTAPDLMGYKVAAI